jgi:hypothetical protein
MEKEEITKQNLVRIRMHKKRQLFSEKHKFVGQQQLASPQARNVQGTATMLHELAPAPGQVA